MLQTHPWKGASGNNYVHTIVDLASVANLESAFSAFNNVNYVFVKKAGILGFTPLYFGEAEELLNRLLGHEKLQSALNLGMNQIHVFYTSAIKTERTAIETDLRRAYATPLNDQGTSKGILGI